MSQSEYSSSSSVSTSSYLHSGGGGSGSSKRSYHRAAPPPPPVYHHQKPLPSSPGSGGVPGVSLQPQQSQLVAAAPYQQQQQQHQQYQQIHQQQKSATLRPGLSGLPPSTNMMMMTMDNGNSTSGSGSLNSLSSGGGGPFSHRSRSTGNLAGQQQQPQSQQQQQPISQYQSRLNRVQPSHYREAGNSTMQQQQQQQQLNPVPVPATSQLSDHELDKVEMFYRSHRTHLFVGRCLVNLYFTETDLVDGGRVSKPRIQDWKLTLTGVPVLIFNKGETKSRDKRQVQIVLAERGTGFPLWSDVIDSLSNYSAAQPSFHTMYRSADHRKMAGLSFDCPAASVEFYRQIEPIISNPLNIGMAGPKKPSKAARFFRVRPRSKSVGRVLAEGKLGGHPEKSSGTLEFHSSSNSSSSSKLKVPPNKADISSPCLFQHVTSVNLYNREEFPSILTSYVNGPAPAHHQQYQSATGSSYQPASISPSNSLTGSSSNNPTPPLYSTPEPMMDSSASSSAASALSSISGSGGLNNRLGSAGSYGDLHSHSHHHRLQHSPTSGTSSSNESNLSY